jgi:putative endonuclease
VFTVYVLRSGSTQRLYTGVTSDLSARLSQHNSDQSTSTKHGGPWQLVHQEEFVTLAEAVRRERFLKTGHGRDELNQIFAGGSAPASDR